MITQILLFLLLVSDWLIMWLLFKLLPTEKQKEVLKKIEPTQGKVIEWLPSVDETKEAAKKVIANL